MFGRPVIFISAVSQELRGARDTVAKVLTGLGYEPKWQDIAPTETGDLRGVLRKWVDDSTAVIQLVGQRYGCEPKEPEAGFGRVSYTQYETLYARQRNKKVWYLLLKPEHPTEAVAPEPVELHDLQTAYRQRVQGDGHLYHPTANLDETKIIVLQLRDDLAKLRRGWKQWAIAILLLLIVAVGIGVATHRSINATHRDVVRNGKTLDEVLADTAETKKLVLSLAKTEAEQKEAHAGEDKDAIEKRAYTFLAAQLGVDPQQLQVQLPKLAEQLKNSPNATPYERANAAYVAKDYAAAARLALRAATEAQEDAPPRPLDALRALELAGWSADKDGDNNLALVHFRKAAELTDRALNFTDWARLQHALTWVLYDQGKYDDVQTVLKSMVHECQQHLGTEHPDTLRARHYYARALWVAGRYPEAEAEYKETKALREKVLGKENRETLMTRNNLALVLEVQKKEEEALKEHQAVLAIRQALFGPTDPDTLQSRSNIAVALRGYGQYLDEQGQHDEARAKYQAAEKEDRERIPLEERIFPKNDPDIFTSRNNLGNDLDLQGRHLEAEKIFREVLASRKEILPAKHADIFRTYSDLARALKGQGRLKEALEDALTAEAGLKIAVSEDEEDYQENKKLLDEIKAELAKGRADQRK